MDKDKMVLVVRGNQGCKDMFLKIYIYTLCTNLAVLASYKEQWVRNVAKKIKETAFSHFAQYILTHLRKNSLQIFQEAQKLDLTIFKPREYRHELNSAVLFCFLFQIFVNPLMQNVQNWSDKL